MTRRHATPEEQSVGGSMTRNTRHRPLKMGYQSLTATRTESQPTSGIIVKHALKDAKAMTNPQPVKTKREEVSYDAKADNEIRRR